MVDDRLQQHGRGRVRRERDLLGEPGDRGRRRVRQDGPSHRLREGLEPGGVGTRAERLRRRGLFTNLFNRFAGDVHF